MKIALIGPAYPYRGGIAHHTNLLAEYLRREGHQVDIITFKRQYPKLLYPGKGQEEAGSKDPPGEAERLIDSINPFNWISVGRKLKKRAYDIIVFKYWLPFFAPAFGTIARIFHRKGRKDVMIIFDNLIPHEKRIGDTALTKFFCRYCNLAITQSGKVNSDLTRLFPSIPQILLPHPVYEHFGATVPREQARQTIGATAKHVLLFFGFVRAYKGLDRLLAAMPEIVRRHPDTHLYVVGEFFESQEPYLKLIRDGGVEGHVTIMDKYVSNDEVADWFCASDMVVLPYVNATNSGIVQIASNFAVPSIVTDVGSLSEVVIDGKTGYVIPNSSKEAIITEIADAVERMYEPGRIEEFAQNIIEERKRYTWDAFAKGMTEFMGGSSGF